MPESYLNVNEAFGPTIQGEGPSTGRLASFLRLSGCNLSCSWCDTPYTWDWARFDHSAETHRWTIAQTMEWAAAQPPAARLVVSGGEPLVQRAALARLLRELPDRAWDVETNGTRGLGDTLGLWSTIVASPKVQPSSKQGVPPLHPEIREYADAFKFVVRDSADLAAVVAYIDVNALEAERVWLMPEGTTPEALDLHTPLVADAAVKYGFNLSTRLHVLAWGDERAR